MKHLFLIFKMYNAFPGILNFTVLKAKIIKVRKIEEEIAKNKARKTQEFHKNGVFCNIYDLFKIS